MVYQSTVNLRYCILAIALALVLTGCAGNDSRDDSAAESARSSPVEPRGKQASAGEQAAVIAVRQVGVPYRYGGANTQGFDCSGLVYYSYASAGVRVPRTTGDLWRHAEPVSADGLQVGDVVFFDIEGKIAHVGLYLGSGRFVHAPATGRDVSIADLNSDFYRKAFVRGGRLR